MPRKSGNGGKIEYIAGEPAAGKTLRRIKGFFVFIAICSLVFLFSAFIKYQYDALASVERVIASVNRDIKAQEDLTLQLEREKQMQGTDAYYEKVARETLGLVYKNEIIFKKR